MRDVRQFLRFTALPLAALTVLLTPVVHAQNDRMRAFLRDQMGFTTADIQAVTAGRAVAKQMKVNGPLEVNIFGAVRLAASADAYVRMLRNMDTYERQLNIQQVGKFHDPPQMADLAGLTLDPEDLAALRYCEAGACKLQMNAVAMKNFRTLINWRAPEAHERANQLFRQLMFDLLNLYRGGGSAATGTYDDYEQPASLASEFALLASSAEWPLQAPALLTHVVDYPRSTLMPREDFFYWNKGEFGMKPTTRLNHVTIYPVPVAMAAGTGARYMVTTKQIYSNHYFSSTLELRTILDDDTQPGRGSILFYTTKSRVTGLTGFIGSIIRGIVRSKARSGMERYLITTQKAVAKGTG